MLSWIFVSQILSIWLSISIYKLVPLLYHTTISVLHTSFSCNNWGTSDHSSFEHSVASHVKTFFREMWNVSQFNYNADNKMSPLVDYFFLNCCCFSVLGSSKSNQLKTSFSGWMHTLNIGVKYFQHRGIRSHCFSCSQGQKSKLKLNLEHCFYIFIENCHVWVFA